MKYAVMVLFFLSACGASPQSRPVVGSTAWMGRLTPDQRELYYSRYCLSQGHRAGTNDFAQCVYGLDENHRLGQIRNQYFDKALD